MLYADRVKETSTTTGTGDVTLAGAVAQFQSFNTAIGTNVYVDYAIVGQTGSEWEVGTGYLSGSTTLVREQPKEGSSGDETLVNLSAGTKDVWLTYNGNSFNSLTGQAVALANNMAWR